ncbi:lipocalin family protein [Tenacibaculum jejuense]|uniref:Lipocalin-like domain-containing protein n=1 Tax=Tenacibaculum jejuense TaxID=584609 RepID=A0A238U8L9_9FLAO|nr:DUF5004 domain-containing protein [Tenacibaculum jejuense]SNR15395.1 exported protein of unknown function [Tenacibaculum jejuense]
MKKIIILSFAFLCLFSCSSNDSEVVGTDGDEVVTDGSGSDGESDNGNGSEAKDPIIGTWTLFTGTDGVEVTECKKKTTFTFNEDNTYSQIEFNTVNNSCSEVVNVTGEWKNEGNNVYNLRRDGFTSGPSVDFEFSEDGKTMVLVRQTYVRN